MRLGIAFLFKYDDNMPLKMTNKSIDHFLQSLSPSRREDIEWLLTQMEIITQCKPMMWGTIVGFGHLHYRYESGHEGDMPILGLANRKQAITLYLSLNIAQYPETKTLGKARFGKSCLYLQSLENINKKALITLMKKGYQESLSYTFVKVISS